MWGAGLPRGRPAPALGSEEVGWRALLQTETPVRVELRSVLKCATVLAMAKGKHDGGGPQQMLVTPARRKRDAEKRRREEVEWAKRSGPVEVRSKES